MIIIVIFDFNCFFHADMDKNKAECQVLIEATLNALNSNTLELLLMEVQQMNLHWRAKKALER